uniref:Uncharacterized protein n=1 Tax=Oryza barthii TaxID=65489 RepID=A0A0D3GPD2_9ORYZ
MATTAGHRSISLTGVFLAKPLSHRFPLPFPFRNQPSQSPPLVAGAILLPAPFRPSPSLPLPTINFPGCASFGNTIRYRRRHFLATTASAPFLSSSRFPG